MITIIIFQSGNYCMWKCAEASAVYRKYLKLTEALCHVRRFAALPDVGMSLQSGVIYIYNLCSVYFSLYVIFSLLFSD